jgi:transcription elongation factor Elf1
MPVNDNWNAVQVCDFCGHTQFVLINDHEEETTKILCARCGVEHLVMNIVKD